MRELSELNINFGGLPVSRKPPSAEEILEFETQFGVKMPPPLVQMLRYSNGGHPERDTFYVALSASRDRVSVDNFYHLGGDRSCPDSLWFAASHWTSILGLRCIPFASDGGGNQFFVDMNDMAVAIRFHDDLEVWKLASSFEAFVDALEMNDDAV